MRRSIRRKIAIGFIALCVAIFMAIFYVMFIQLVEYMINSGNDTDRCPTTRKMVDGKMVYKAKEGK